MNKVSMEEIVSLAKRRGFIYPGSEIYGGLAGTYDYGPLGVALKNNVKALWWKRFVTDREDMYGIDAAILMNPKAWVASGHVGGFSDPLVECESCGKRFRVDQIVDQDEYRKYETSYARFLLERVKKGAFEDKAVKVLENTANRIVDKFSESSDDLTDFLMKMKRDQKEITEAQIVAGTFSDFEDFQKYTGEIAQYFLNRNVRCANCGEKKWKEPRQFNMMFQTEVGATEGSVSYLRPETAGGMFVNFKNVIDSFHPKLPFGLAQIGKAFRNEIAPRDFVFRSREFEQMEVEYFVHPSSWEAAFEEWHGVMHAFAKEVGIKKSDIHDLEVAMEDRAHYSKRTIDFEFEYPFGRKELWGLAYRTDFDLTAHENTSGVTLKYSDEEIKDPLTPHVIEPSLGVDRTILAILVSAYEEDQLGEERRIVLRLPKAIAPYRACVSPLLKNKPELVAKAREVFMTLKKSGIAVTWDDNGNIGKRYRRQDEIGTPSCIVIDFDTLGEKPELLDTVTVRDRDTGEQERVAIAHLVSRLG